MARLINSWGAMLIRLSVFGHYWLRKSEIHGPKLHVLSHSCSSRNSRFLVPLVELIKCTMPGSISMVCRAGFSLMFYGFGSKRQFINDFVVDKLTDGGLVEVNAWLSAVSAKQIVAAALSALLGEPEDKLRCELASSDCAVDEFSSLPGFNIQELHVQDITCRCTTTEALGSSGL